MVATDTFNFTTTRHGSLKQQNTAKVKMNTLSGLSTASEIENGWAVPCKKGGSIQNDYRKAREDRRVINQASWNGTRSNIQ